MNSQQQVIQLKNSISYSLRRLYFIRMICLILFFSLFFENETFSQKDSMIMVSGMLIEKDNRQPVPFAYIASYTQHLMYSSDSTGMFYIQLPVHDSIKIVMLGFEPVTVKLDSVILSNRETVVIPLKRTSFVLNNIDVNLRRGFYDLSSNDTIGNKLLIPESVMSGLSNIVDIREVMALQRAKSGTFGITPGTIEMIVRFFKKLKRRKHPSVFKYNNEHLKELTSLQNISVFTGLQGAKLDSFIIFFEKDYVIDPKLSDYEIMEVVQNAYKEFIARSRESDMILKPTIIGEQ